MIAWLTDTLLTTAALIVLVLALRRPAAQYFGAQISYALWALPLLRFALPPLVLPASFAPQAGAVQTTVATTTVLTDSSGVPAGILPVPAYDPSFWELWGRTIVGATAAIWLAGALIFLAWRAWTYLKMREWLLDGARPVGEAGKVRLVESPAVSSPVAFGVSDKVVALPLGFMASENRAARDLAIEHELAHHRGHDLLANICAQPLLALHWFNPLAWLGWRAMRRDQEAACDARVIAARGPRERAAYGRVIASFASGQRLALAAPMACPVLGEKSIIHRLRSLGMDEISPRRRMAGRLLLAGAALTLPFTASISYAEASAAPRTSSSTVRSEETITRLETQARAAQAQAEAAVHAARFPTAGQRQVLATLHPSMSDKDWAEYDAQWAKHGDEWARQGEVAAKAAEKSAAAWSNWGEEYGKAWSDWGEKLGNGIAASAPPTPPSPRAPAAPRAPVASVELPVPSYGCDRDGNLMKIGPNGRNAASAGQLKWCGKVANANANARRALVQARARIASDRTMDEDARDQVLDSLDNEIDRLDEIADAND